MLRHRPAENFVGVIGWPLQHSLSPVIHAAAFRELGLDWVYLAWPVVPGDLEAAVKGMKALGGLGANVTMPHKETVLAYLDDLSGDARAVGAVNTIQRVGDRFVGHNTDVDGFRDFLVADAGVDVADCSALVLGAGGAARAVAAALDRLGAATVAVAARRGDRAESVLDLIPGSRGEAIRFAGGELPSERFDVVVNATPVGTGGGDPLAGARWRPGQVVVDLVYDPPATELVERARAAGARAWGGLGMLVHQAAASFRIWTGRDAPLETMSAAALHGLGRKH